MSLLKEKLLLVASTGKFATFDPPKLQKYKDEVNIFLASSPNISSIETYSLIELQFYLCILSNDDKGAERALGTILARFESSSKSQRIKLLQSIYYEATGEPEKAKELLATNPDEVRLSRRLVTFSRSEDNTAYINNLVFYLDKQPGDLLAWAELGDEYFAIGHYDEAVYCFKEVLLHEPLAYHWFYRCGLALYYKYLQKKDTQALVNARNNFLRCIEIYHNHRNSWLGVNIVTKLQFPKEYQKENAQLLKKSEKKLAELKEI